MSTEKRKKKKILTMFNWANPEEYLDLFKPFLMKPVKWDNY